MQAEATQTCKGKLCTLKVLDCSLNISLPTVFSLPFSIISMFGDTATHFKVTSTQIFPKQGVMGPTVASRNFMSSHVLCKGITSLIPVLPPANSCLPPELDIVTTSLRLLPDTQAAQEPPARLNISTHSPAANISRNLSTSQLLKMILFLQ